MPPAMIRSRHERKHTSRRTTVMRLSSHVWRVRAWYLYARERSRRSAMVAADVGSEKVLVPVPVQFVIVCDGRGIGSGIGYAQK